MDVIQLLMERAQKINGTIVLAEGEDHRVLKAARIITKQKIAKVIVLGKREEIEKQILSLALDMTGIDIIDPQESENKDEYAYYLFEKRKHKGMTLDESLKKIEDPLYYGAVMVDMGVANGVVAGAVRKTSEVMRSALQVIGPAEGVSIVSSSFVMIIPDYEFGQRGIYLFADCAVNKFPDSEQLAEIAFQTARTSIDLIDMDAKVAFLTYSTKGSAVDETTQKVIDAVKIAQDRFPTELYPDIIFDGEFQLDAAIEPLVAEVKDPHSPIAGKANILVFPNLEAGNIGYKLVHRFANAEVIGPISQGLKKPVSNLSRGSSISDIINSILVTLLQSIYEPIIPTKEIDNGY